MASLSVVVKYYPPNDVTNPTTVNDVVQIQINKSSEVQNNKARIKVKNCQVGALSDGTSRHSASTSDGTLKFEQDGVVKVWAKYDEGAPIDTSSDSEDLLFVGDLIGIKGGQSPGKNEVELTFVDRTFTILNRVWSENITDTPVPNIIQSIIRSTTDHSIKPSEELFKADGTFGGIYEIDARLTSEGGFIADTRIDSSPFPTATMAQTFKPVADWIGELSEVDTINYAEEVATDSYVQKRAMLYHVDERNRFHWYYPTSGTADVTLVAGQPLASGTANPYYIYEHTTKRDSADIVNFIIFDCGTDISGDVIQDYEYDPNAGTPIPKDSFRPYQDISLNMKDDDVKAGNLTKVASGDKSYTYTIAAAYPFTPAWNEKDPDGNDILITSTATYNSNFRNIATLRGKRRARKEMRGRSNLRLKDPVRVRGTSEIGVGDLIKFTSPAAGERKVDVRVKQVTHVINKVGWTTEVSFEEDEPELEVSLSS